MSLAHLAGVLAATMALATADDVHAQPLDDTKSSAPDANVDRRDVAHSELGVLPAFGVSSDTGVQLGAYGQIAWFQPGARPYAARLRMQAALSIRDAEGGLELPFHDHFVRLDLPGFPNRTGRLWLDLGYERLTRGGYYGRGNASAAAAPSPDPSNGYFSSYLSEQLAFRLSFQQMLASPEWRLYAGVGIARHNAESYAGSRLAIDIQTGEAPPGVRSYFQSAVLAGLILDTRNHETFPTSGLFHDLVLRAAPPGASALPFAGATLTTRFYGALAGEYLVVATRLLADVMVGDVPLAELGRFGGVLGQSGPGGQNGVRGIPLERYIGKTKVIGNLELRSLFLPFDIGRQHFAAGAAAFVDAGRVWTRTLGVDEARDGRALGLHFGYGGGPRLRWGDSFLLRLDIAYAPGAGASGHDGAVGAYLTTDATF
jgi:Omp85 superfamily domain